MRKLFSILCLTLLAFDAGAHPTWLPAHFTVPTRTISPDDRYGVMMPDAWDGGASKLVELKTGRVVATLVGGQGWERENHSMRWGQMEATWSADSSTLCWVYPGKWFPESLVVLKLHGKTLAWQKDLMKPAQAEILARTEEAAPDNFAAAKLENAGDGSAYPEGFSVDVSTSTHGLSLPLTCEVSLTSNSKGSDEEPDENGVLAWLVMTVSPDGSIGYSKFRVKPGALSPDEMKKVAAAKITYPLVDTKLGKAVLFTGMDSEDGRYAVGWTVRAAIKDAAAPVDWSRWDATNPDKLLRRYDWQSYGDEKDRPYKVVNFVLDRRNSEVVELPAASPHWPWKRNGWQMRVQWCAGKDGALYGLVTNGNLGTENFWLVTAGARLGEKDLSATIRQQVDNLLRDRRPEIADTKDFFVTYRVGTEGCTVSEEEMTRVPFVATPNVSNELEFGLNGVVTLRPSDATVVAVSSDTKRLEPFVTNEELRKADDELNTAYQSALKSMPQQKAVALRQKQRAWVAQRDVDAAQAVNVTPYGSTADVYEQAREKSLLDSTRKRLGELQDLVHH